MIYNLNFKTIKESTSWSKDEVVYSGALGNLVCKILSADFFQLASVIPEMVFDAASEKSNSPTSQIDAMLSNTFARDFLDSYKDISSITTLAEAAYTIFCDKRTDEHYRPFFTRQIFTSLSFFIALQAYLNEVENSPMLANANYFEQFVLICLHKNIPRNVCVETVSDGGFLDVINCPVRHMEGQPTAEEIRSIIKKWVDDLSGFDEDDICIETYYMSDLLIAAIYYIFQHGYTFKRCKNCGKLFVPLSRSDELYCNCASPQDNTKTCKQYGSERLWYERLKEDEAAKLSRNVYMAKQMLVKRNPDIEAYAKMFEYFKSERKKWETEIKNGAKTKEEYIRWLNEIKQKKTLSCD